MSQFSPPNDGMTAAASAFVGTSEAPHTGARRGLAVGTDASASAAVAEWTANDQPDHRGVGGVYGESLHLFPLFLLFLLQGWSSHTHSPRGGIS